ncbi:MAG: nucleotidyltransferase domain-containing protein [Bacteroidota bacterium]
MASLSAQAKKAIKKFIARIEAEIAPELVILYGSHARGGARSTSDIDIAVFAKKFNRKSFIDATSYLFSKTSGLNVDLQPVGFPFQEYLKQNGEYFIEIIKTQGVVVYAKGKFTI